MDTLHGNRSTAATRFAVSEIDYYHQQRVTRMYERSWSAQQKIKASGLSVQCLPILPGV
jgi:hypothetical protein